ncbi:hypothetical protein ACLE20_13405 [Rhizobium sp. YIM 134829]|uniref:hypothetical protein n=1 Tax=Rhizobium sp. YIM 134829 TaxID=3390453 RepID=UPI00397E74A1
MPDLYITTQSGLAFDDSFIPPANGDYGLTLSFDPRKGFSADPIANGSYNGILLRGQPVLMNSLNLTLKKGA